ncbi:MAG TPA: DUF2125 domain-containing protein, partial [Amaricoccus sp.]|nr:DUF2125 domain-containing protein [Amaricoccus sp.]
LGWSAGIGKAILATRQTGGTPFAHDVAVGPVALDTTLAFDRPWDRSTVEGDNPRLDGVEVRKLALEWGELDLSGSGDLTADADGLAEGRIDLRARNWRTMLDVAEASGALNPTVASAVRAGLGLLAGFGGDAETLSVPLDFADGRTRLGPIPLGPAPRLALR